jgi:hypothetical protein
MARKITQFVEGQKVVCINSEGTEGRLTYGKVYQFESADKPWKESDVEIVYFGRWAANRFTAYEEPKEPVDNTKKPHIHAQMIIAWANGESIEFSEKGKEYWNAADFPSWNVALDYRIKKEPAYPKTTLTGEVLVGMFYDCQDDVKDSHVHVANEAIKHFIVSGDMDKYIESLK